MVGMLVHLFDSSYILKDLGREDGTKSWPS